MLVSVIAGHFDLKLGRPTKGLYSTAGLLLIMDSKTGGNVIQDLSDPDAPCLGRKPPGCQALIAEACNREKATRHKRYAANSRRARF